jgi:heme-degrading monooxygenase HmoA
MNQKSTQNSPEVLALFRFRRQPDADGEELSRLWNRMYEIATTTPEIGLLGTERWMSDDGGHLVIYRFPSLQAMNEFVRHPEHRGVMRRGAEFFSFLETQICFVERESTFQPAAASQGPPLEAQEFVKRYGLA